MIRKILVATDGSRHADKAVTLATDLADKYRARLLLLHVLATGDPTAEEKQLAKSEGLAKRSTATRVGTIEATPHGPHPLPVGEHEEVDTAAIRRTIGERIIGAAKTVAEKSGVATDGILEDGGDEAERIVEVARRERPDILVMGSRGMGSLQGLLLGSVSQKVAKHADCTCITVK